MLYFNSLPQIFTPDENGNPIVLTNLLTRAKLLDELKNNPMLFYKYTIQEGDTPEIIADKYYDDTNRFWMVLYSNELLDPLWDWPLTQQEFLKFIEGKYSEKAQLENKTTYEYVISTIHSYEKIIETIDSVTSTTTKNIVSIDSATYNSLTPSTQTYNLSDGNSCTINIDKRTVTIYDYEYELNESKREIRLLNSVYANQMEQTFREVMSK